VLDASARSIVAAIVPVLLEGALPTGNDAITARADVLAGVDRTVAGLLPAVRDELDQLFGLLAFTTLPYRRRLVTVAGRVARIGRGVPRQLAS